MRNSYIVRIIAGIFLLAGILSCNDKKDPHGKHTGKQVYTCPMHPQIVRDKPGKCPICGMDLVLKEANNELIIDSSIAALAKPVNRQVVADISIVKPESGTRIFSSEVQGVITYDSRSQTSISSRVSGRIERLPVKYNYQPVRKGQLIMEVYAADLTAAQRELLYISGNSPELLPAAKQRLQLMGMQPAQINQVLKTGEILYRVPIYSNSDGYILEQPLAQQSAAPNVMPAASVTGGDGMAAMSGSGKVTPPAPAAPTATPVLLREGQYINAGQSLFTIYKASTLVAEFAFPPKLASRVHRGDKILFYPTDNQDKMQSGSIGLIEPVFRNGSNFSLARVYVKDQALRIGQLLNGNIAVVYRDGWWLPRKAVWRLGNQSIIFKKEKGVFVPMKVETGIEDNNLVQVITNIGDWEVASNAYYLVDSESFIKSEN